MVIFHLQTSKEAEFLYETPNTTPMSEAITEIATIHNSILRIHCIIGYLKELIQSGPMDDKGQRSNPPENAELLDRAVADAEAAISAEQAQKKFLFTTSYISDELKRIEGSLSIAYPNGLPETEPVRKVIEGCAIEGELDPMTCQLWWARKSLSRDKNISDYFGNNSRTKAVAKLTDAHSGEPPREMSKSKEAQIKLISSINKKEEEFKKKIDDDDDIDSEWANPNGLKNTINGLDNISWKPH